MNEPAAEGASLNLSSILRGGGDVSSHGELATLELVKTDEAGNTIETIAIALDGPLRWRASVSHVGGDEFWLGGRVQGVALLECARCLEPTSAQIEARLEALLRHDPKVKVPYMEIDGDDQDVIVFGDPSLNLEPFLAEAFNLELPLSVLHAPDCQGLCVACGTNLNRLEAGTCAAKRSDCPQLRGPLEPDHPLAGLGALRDSLKD